MTVMPIRYVPHEGIDHRQNPSGPPYGSVPTASLLPRDDMHRMGNWSSSDDNPRQRTFVVN